MKSLTTDMIAHIAQDVTSLCALWKIVRTDGVVMGFTDHDADILYDGITYVAETGFFRSAISNTSTLSTDELTVNGLLDTDAITEIDLRAGRYDYAEVTLFMVNWQDLTMGQINLRYGHFGEVTMTPTGTYKIELRGLVETLQQTVGQTISPECDADLGDSRCKFVVNPPLRQSLMKYTVGSRVLINSVTADKVVALALENADFGAVFASALDDWVLDNAIISDGNAQAAEWCVETVDYIATVSQNRTFQDVFAVATEDGATGVASIYWKSATIYQQSRLYLSFLDSGGVEIGNAFTDYKSITDTYTQATVAFTVPTGAHSITFKVQTRKLNTPANPPETPWDSSLTTFIDTASMVLTPLVGAPAEMLLEPAFTVASTSTTRTAGWTPGTAVHLLSVTSWFQMTAPASGNYFLVMELGEGLSSTQSSSATSGEIDLTAAGNISGSDIDSGLFEIVTTWQQANAGEFGTAGIGLTFYNASNAVLQTIAPVLKQINPWFEWQNITQSNLVPVGARFVKYTLTYGVPDGSSVVIYPQSVITNILSSLQHIGAGVGVSQAQYSGVEYECTSPGVTAEATPSGFSTTLGATINDGSLVWTVVEPRFTFLGSIASMTSRSVFVTTGFTTQVNNFFQWGTCEFLSGQNVGIVREIITQIGMNITLMLPPPFPVAPSDIVVLTVGCDHTIATCFTKFNNVINYRGFPAVPGTDQYFQVGNPAGTL